MPIIFFITFAIIFALIVNHNFRIGVGILIMLLPSYLVRFSLGRFPSTLLELTFLIILAVWLIKYFRSDIKKIWEFIKQNKYVTLFATLFFIASIISIFISDMWWFSFGEWRAYFLEPMILFTVLIGRRDEIQTEDLLVYLSLSTISIAVFGIIQKFTGFGLPTAEWRNISTRRITSFFTSPNAVGLYLGPLLFLTASQFWASARKKILYFGIASLSLLAIFFTMSLGTWIAIFLGALLFLFLVKQKRTAVILLTLAIVPIFFRPVQSYVFSKQRSGDNRFLLWSYSTEFLTRNPKNFVFGTGVRQFYRKIQKPHYKKEVLERLIYPHNIFLNFWTETGLLGMISFIVIYGMLIKRSIGIYKIDRLLGATFLAMLSAFLVHGMIDVPYFKNDLAMMFWVISAMIFVYKPKAV